MIGAVDGLMNNVVWLLLGAVSGFVLGRWWSTRSAPRDTSARKNAPAPALEKIGISGSDVAALRALGILTGSDLLEHCRSASDRAALAERLELPFADVLRWAGITDLARIPGISIEQASLLADVNIDSVQSLAGSRPAALSGRIAQHSAQSPPASTVVEWVDSAKKLAPRLFDLQ